MSIFVCISELFIELFMYILYYITTTTATTTTVTVTTIDIKQHCPARSQ